MTDEEFMGWLKGLVKVQDVSIHRHPNVDPLGGGVEVADVNIAMEGKLVTVPLDLPFNTKSLAFVIGRIEEFSDTLERA